MAWLNVSNIQHFSTGDGPGIRTTVFLKGCNLRCPWCHNPETISPLPQTLCFAATGHTQTFGVRMSVEQVVAEVMEDVDFYRASGGGVTVSGGEPLLQAEGVAALAKALFEHGVSTVIDTAGCVPWERFACLIDSADAFYFDYKTSDRAIYANMIGGDADLVYANLCRLIGSGARVRVRIPLIPGVNTCAESCVRMCEQLLAAGVEQVDLLPFHRMGLGKYEAMGMQYAFGDVQPLSKSEIDKIADIYRQYFEITVEF
ncbi:MAG: radical SAM protein [Clostridia bacterium]|nr:radical SAM protein [Clostridia bacterium]